MNSRTFRRWLPLVVYCLFMLGAPRSAMGTPMELSIQGYVYGGFDAYGSTFGLPAGIAYQTPLEVTFRYDTANLGPEIYSTVYGINDGSQLYANRAFSPNWYSPSQYPSFLSADFTLNGITVAMDTRWSSRIDSYRFWDSFGISGSADRAALDPNGGQAAEGINFSAHMGGQLFDPLAPMIYANPFGSIGEGFIRLFDSPNPATRSYYPEGRFTDGQLHWVEIYFIATEIEIKEASGRNAVPDNMPVASGLGLGLLGLGLVRRRAGARA